MITPLPLSHTHSVARGNPIYVYPSMIALGLVVTPLPLSHTHSVARDNPLYVDPSTVEEEVEAAAVAPAQDGEP